MIISAIAFMALSIALCVFGLAIRYAVDNSHTWTREHGRDFYGFNDYDRALMRFR
jgi:hypothetical protein